MTPVLSPSWGYICLLYEATLAETRLGSGSVGFLVHHKLVLFSWQRHKVNQAVNLETLEETVTEDSETAPP